MGNKGGRQVITVLIRGMLHVGEIKITYDGPRSAYSEGVQIDILGICASQLCRVDYALVKHWDESWPHECAFCASPLGCILLASVSKLYRCHSMDDVLPT